MNQTPFADLDDYIALPRVNSLVLSQDGKRLAVSVATLNPERTAYVSALWQVDPTGATPARRLTRSAQGESSAVFTSNGDLLFTSARPDPDATKDGKDDKLTALWRLPAGGGEAELIATAPGGVSDPLAARQADVIAVTVPVMPAAGDLNADAELRKTRKDLKVAAILHDSYPVRYWDHDLGPDQPRRFVATLSQGARPELRQITGAGRQLEGHSADLNPDGTTLVTSWEIGQPGASRRSVLMLIDVVTGERRVLVDEPGANLEHPVFSPDGSRVAYLRHTISTPLEAPKTRLAIVRAVGGVPEIMADDWDRWPESIAWLPDGSGLVVTADDDGRSPVFLVTLGETTVVEPITGDDFAYSDVCVAAGDDPATIYALQTSYLTPPRPVRIDLSGFIGSGTPGGRQPVEAIELRSPVEPPALPGKLREVETTTGDGTRVRAWLALPDGASDSAPAPLLLWIHGGPLSSWNAWSWRWNPWLMVARGYAVLMPDPALSTGYGQAFVQRGWGRWGAEPYADLMAITDTVIGLPEIDETRTAAMGGSFGGYMANWVAGHTDRFKAIVSHAGLWALDQFGPTTDSADFWQRELTPQMALENSPHRFVGNIRTPMLVVHGNRDFRVPFGEGLRLWYELLANSGLPAAADGTTCHRFLYFPDENHWILSPQHARVWYETVFAFLGEHVLGEPATWPDVLG